MQPLVSCCSAASFRQLAHSSNFTSDLRWEQVWSWLLFSVTLVPPEHHKNYSSTQHWVVFHSDQSTDHWSIQWSIGYTLLTWMEICEFFLEFLGSASAYPYTYQILASQFIRFQNSGQCFQLPLHPSMLCSTTYHIYIPACIAWAWTILPTNLPCHFQPSALGPLNSEWDRTKSPHPCRHYLVLKISHPLSLPPCGIWSPHSARPCLQAYTLCWSIKPPPWLSLHWL